MIVAMGSSVLRAYAKWIKRTVIPAPNAFVRRIAPMVPNVSIHREDADASNHVTVTAHAERVPTVWYYRLRAPAIASMPTQIVKGSALGLGNVRSMTAAC